MQVGKTGSNWISPGVRKERLKVEGCIGNEKEKDKQRIIKDLLAAWMWTLGRHQRMCLHEMVSWDVGVLILVLLGQMSGRH